MAIPNARSAAHEIDVVRFSALRDSHGKAAHLELPAKWKAMPDVRMLDALERVQLCD